MSRKTIISTCSSCNITWERRYRPDQGSMCKKCTSTVNGLKATAVIKNKPKVGKECLACGKFSYWIQKSDYCMDCIKSKMPKGEEHYNWQGGITKETKYLRSKFIKYTQPKVLRRDKYTCQLCTKTNTYLHVDHIQKWSEFPELRFELDNCRTLCRNCHYQITFGKPMPSNSQWGIY